MKGDRRRPDERARRRRPGRTLALALAIVVHLVFIGFLVWSVRWQSRPPEPVTAELYAPPQKIREPDPKPEPKPEPKSEPEPKPPPPPPPPPPKVEPDNAEIALKAKREEERRAKEKAERDRKLAEEKRAAETKERLARETDAMRDAAEREARERAAVLKARADAEKAKADAERAKADADARAKAEAEAKARVEAEARARAQAQAQAESNARAAAQADWVRRIQAKVRGNVVLPPDLPGNPEAVFEVIQLPTGEIIEAQLRKSSGVKAYDEALQRAIVKSSPLPRPDRQDLFMRALTLRFRPQD